MVMCSISGLDLQSAYDGGPAGGPLVTVDGTVGPFALRDNGTPQSVFTVEDNGGSPVLTMNADDAVSSAMIDMASTTQGLRIPQMTEVQRDAIGTPLTGLLIFNTTTGQTNQYDGSSWTVPGGGLTDLQTAYDNNPAGAQILLDNVPNPFTVQASVAGTVIEWRDVSGNPIFQVTADPDTVECDAGFTIRDAFLNAGAANSLVMADTFTSAAPFIGGGILSNGTVTYTNGVFIWALLQESKAYACGAAPGFAAFTLFNALSVIRNSGNFDLVQALVLNVGVTHERVTAGTSTTIQTVGMSFSAQTRTTAVGAIMTRSTGMTAVRVAPTFSTVGFSTVNMGTVCGLQCIAPAVALFGSSAGVENLTAYYGIDFANITFTTSGDKVVVRSAMTDAADRFFLQNNGGARSDLGGGALFDCGTVQVLADNIGVQLGAAGADVLLNWNGSAFEWDFLSGDDLRLSAGTNSHTLQSANFGTASELRLGFDKYAFGQTGAVGNQVGIFVAPARATSVAGEWSDFLLTQAGNLTIDHAMTGLYAWTLNALSLTTGAGSLTGEVGTFNVGGMTTSGLGGNPTSALRVTGRHHQRGMTRYPPIAPANLSGSVTGWAGLLTGSQNNNARHWARITCDAATTLHGIDSTAALDGDTYELTNVGANALTVANQSVTETTAANRIILGAFGGTLGVDETITIRYDGTTARWRVVGD